MNAAPKAVALKALFLPAAEFQALRTDIALLQPEAIAISVNASNAIIAVTTPWFFIRGALAVYLGKPTLGAKAFAVAATLLREALLHEGAKQIPFIGTVIALAEMIKKQEEGGYRDFITFVKQASCLRGPEKCPRSGTARFEHR